MTDKLLPFYQDVDGFRIPGAFSAEVFREGLTYKPRPDDLFVSTYPKCGTTWTQMIVSLIFNEGKPVKDYVEFSSRTPFLEMTGAEGVEKMQRPGTIKIHLPFQMTPYSPDAKYIYVVRNPKDSLLSFYHHTCSDLYKFGNGELDVYFELFINGKTDFGDFFDNVLGWYEHRNDPNILFFTYEELKRDTRDMVKKIARFMGDKYEKIIEDEEVLGNVLKYSSIDYMKTVFNDSFEAIAENAHKSSVDPEKIPTGLKHIMKVMAELKTENAKNFTLIRSGNVGDGKKKLSEEQNSRLDEKIETKLKGTELYTLWKSLNCI